MLCCHDERLILDVKYTLHNNDWPSNISYMLCKNNDWPSNVSYMLYNNNDWPSNISYMLYNKNDWPEPQVSWQLVMEAWIVNKVVSGISHRRKKNI